MHHRSVGGGDAASMRWSGPGGSGTAPSGAERQRSHPSTHQHQHPRQQQQQHLQQHQHQHQQRPPQPPPQQRQQHELLLQHRQQRGATPEGAAASHSFDPRFAQPVEDPGRHGRDPSFLTASSASGASASGGGHDGAPLRAPWNSSSVVEAPATADAGGAAAGGGGGGGGTGDNDASLTKIGYNIRMMKRMLSHATRLALADSDTAAEQERVNLSEVEKAMHQKRQQDAATVAESQDPETYIQKERGWWDAELQGWHDRREAFRQDMERQALDKLLATQTPEQMRELQNPEAAQKWLGLMEASMHPFISEVNKTLNLQPRAQPPSPSRSRRPVPTEREWQSLESRSGLWSTVPRTTEAFTEARTRNLRAADWSTTFSNGALGAQGELQDRYWDPQQQDRTDPAHNRSHASSRTRSPPNRSGTAAAAPSLVQPVIARPRHHHSKPRSSHKG